MLSGVAKFTNIITIMVVAVEYLEAVSDTIDNGSFCPKTQNTITILDSKPTKKNVKKLPNILSKLGGK